MSRTPTTPRGSSGGSTTPGGFPTLQFVIAEYNPSRTEANMIMKELANGRGLGTFFWEPTRSGDWGAAMFSWSGATATANHGDFAEYDALLPTLGL
ncbi:MAG TPA: hypothetical protein VI197_02675 [Polyangiaceae bacterium]